MYRERIIRPAANSAAPRLLQIVLLFGEVVVHTLVRYGNAITTLCLLSRSTCTGLLTLVLLSLDICEVVAHFSNKTWHYCHQVYHTCASFMTVMNKI